MKLVYIYVHGDPDDPIPIARTQPLGDRVLIDYDHDGNVFGVEILDAQRVVESDISDEENSTLNTRLHHAREKVRDYLSKGEHA